MSVCLLHLSLLYGFEVLRKSFKKQVSYFDQEIDPGVRLAQKKFHEHFIQKEKC
jgi:hypothetical protein